MTKLGLCFILLMSFSFAGEEIRIFHYYSDPSQDTSVIKIENGKIWNGEFELNRSIDELAASYHLFENQIFIDVSLDSKNTIKKGIDVIRAFKKNGINHSVRFKFKKDKVNCLTVARFFSDATIRHSGEKLLLYGDGEPLKLDADLNQMKGKTLTYRVKIEDLNSVKNKESFIATLQALNSYDKNGNRLFLYNLFLEF